MRADLTKQDSVLVNDCEKDLAGYFSPVENWSHKPKCAGSNPAPATI